MDANDAQTLEEIEAEILAILDDCRKRGLSKDEIRDIFSPLGLPDHVAHGQSGNEDTPDNCSGDSEKGRRRRASVRAGSTWKRTLFYVAMVAIIGIIAIQFYEEELKGIRFHALAIARIVLIKVPHFS